MKKILIIEDDQNLLNAMQDYFTNLNMQVFAFSHSRSLLKKIKTLKPDLAIFDIWIEPLAGDQLCKSIKSKSRSSKLPVILISAKEQLKKTAREVGADDYLTKPFDLPELGDLSLKLLSS